jgi:hypothetical protein
VANLRKCFPETLGNFNRQEAKEFISSALAIIPRLPAEIPTSIAKRIKQQEISAAFSERSRNT